MNIGIDVDDTIANTSVLVYNEIAKNIKKYENVENMEDKIRDMMRGIISEEDRKLMDVNISDLLSGITSKENASNVIEYIKNKENKIYIITSRSNEVLECDAHLLTKTWLEKNNIIYDEIIINAGDKLDICRENNIDVMIDDSVYICDLLNKNNIRSIIFNSPTNISVQTDIERVDSWNELKNMI